MFSVAPSRQSSLALIAVMLVNLHVGPGSAYGSDLDIVISELMYHGTSPDMEREYLEITNRGSQTVDLTDWRIADGIDYDFPPGTTLSAGQRLVVALDPAAVETFYGITGVLGPYLKRLANDGERIESAADEIRWVVIVAIIASFVGDICDVAPQNETSELMQFFAFLVAHVFYIVGLLKPVELVVQRIEIATAGRMGHLAGHEVTGSRSGSPCRSRRR